LNKKIFIGIATAILLLTATFPNLTLAPDANDLGIEPLFQHKDTRMLCLRGCNLTGNHAWDAAHEVSNSSDVASCDHCKWYCVVASIAMIASYFGGNLSQDRITNYLYREVLHNSPETDLAHGWGLSVNMATQALSWALNGVEIYHEGHPDPWPFPKPPLEQIKQWIDSGRPILRQWLAHYTVIDGYDGEYIHVIDPWTGTESRIHYNDLDMYNRWIPPANAIARSDEPTIWQDSDSDGIVNFDETNRFFTDPHNPDTDKDGIDDKTEIRSYTFLSDDNFDLNDTRKPDADNDTLRAELDFDSDNGGTSDGLEDLDRDGRLDTVETDPFDPTDDPLIIPPTASFEYYPEKPWATETVTFNALASYSKKGNITSYQWDFNDGNITTVTQPIINHTYQPGKYFVTLKVTDNNTLSNTAAKAITIFYRTDVNKDGAVNIQDLFKVAQAFNAKFNVTYGRYWHDPPCKYCPHSSDADLNDDKSIDIIDLYRVAKDFGKSL